jgi:hypothetical protein
LRIEDVVIVDTVAYLVNNGLHILDLSDPSQPVEVSAYATSGGVGDVAAAGEYAYLVVRGALHIVDVSSLADSFELSRLDFDGMPEYGGRVATVAEYAYVAGEQRLHVVDVSDPALPKEILSDNRLDSANGIAAEADHIYIADGSNGLVILRRTSLP